MNKTHFKVIGNRLVIKRKFNAPLELVWRTWTEPELLDQWWAPKPWKAETVHMEFKPGGHRLYAMVSPEGEKHWSRIDYKEIKTHDFFSGLDSFCDDQGIFNPKLPSARYQNRFVRLDLETEIQSEFIYQSKQALITIVDMGMKQGLEMACENLDILLSELKKIKMNKVTVENTINKNVQEVWKFWTTIEHIIHWNFASPEWHCPTAEHDLKVGGKLKYNMAARDGSMAFDYTATFTVIKPNELLEYVLEDGRKVSISFVDKGDTTQIRETFEVEDKNSVDMQRQGWQAILDNFKKYVESN